MITILKITLPLVVLAGAGFGAAAIIRAKPPVESHRPEIRPPLVLVERVRLSDRQLAITSQGTVSPRTESQLIPEVSGRVVWVAPAFVPGGFFAKDEVLLRIDKLDYERAVVRATADVAARRLRLAQEEAEAAVARDEWAEIGGGAEAAPLTLRVPHLEEARASLAAAEAALEQAKRDLERTEVRAPYAGRVRQKLVDVGEFVTRGAPVARLYAVDYAEIRLPLPDSELAFVDLPLGYRGGDDVREGPRVHLHAEFAGATHEWEGEIVRTEGEIDPASRMVHAVARVEDPYGRAGAEERPPLAVGLFVSAEIEGHLAKGVACLPRAALRGSSQVWVIDGDSRLRFRKVDVLRTTRTEAIVRGGLEEGERVCLSAMEAVTDGMRVCTQEAGEPSGAEPTGARGARP
ncbi:MAG: efflux RND transporter periplasmic adaptor subunit [Planctomycetota bacterium]